MKIIFNALMAVFIFSSVTALCSCNTTNGLSHDVNKFSDSVHRTINS